MAWLHKSIRFVFDEPIYIGRVEMKLNDGKKENFYTFSQITKLKQIMIEEFYKLNQKKKNI